MVSMVFMKHAHMAGLEQPLACACAKSGLQVQLSVPDFFLLYCPHCETIVAGHPVLDSAGPVAARLLALSTEESAQVRQAVQLLPDGPLVDVLTVFLGCTLPAALRLVQQRLGQRAGFITELAAALSGSDRRERLLSLQLVARMPQVPPELVRSVLYAVQLGLSAAPGSEEVLVALMAAHPVAAQARVLRGRVEQIYRRTEGVTGGPAELTRRVAAAVLDTMARADAATKERFIEARDRIAALVQEGQLAEALAVLASAYPEDDPNDHDRGRTGRSALCEAAAQTLLGDPRAVQAANTLLNWSLEYALEYASWATSGGEGQARMLDVDRLRGLLSRLPLS